MWLWITDPKAALKAVLNGQTVGFSSIFMSQKNHEKQQEESSSGKKDPELFENEPLDMQPSRKGRIVSTMIVIVVAILVIWVFARNNEEPTQEAASEETKQEETASAEPLEETETTANKAANPEDKLAQLKDEFGDSWQKVTDEITASKETALTNFDDKKTAATEKLAEVSENFKKSADKLIDQGLSSAKKKVNSIADTNLKSLATLQTKTLAKSTAEQLETALPKATEQLNTAKDQVMAAINDNTDQLTTTIDQAVTKALEQNEKAKQELAEQSVAETEVTGAETETQVTKEEVKPAVSNEGIEVTAEPGDSITKMARRALASAMDSGKVSRDLSAEKRIYIEDYMQNRTGSHWIDLDESLTFSIDLINEAVDHANNLSEAQLDHLQIYSSQVSF